MRWKWAEVVLVHLSVEVSGGLEVSVTYIVRHIRRSVAQWAAKEERT